MDKVAKTRKSKSPAQPADQKEPFPPLSTSLGMFIKDGSDERFRHLIYNVLSVSSLMLSARAHFAAHVGVTAPQYSMMVVIGEEGETTVSQIADRLHVTGPFVTSEIGKLLKRKLVQKRPNAADGRSHLLQLTEAGKERIRLMGPIREQANDVIFGSLSEKQTEQLEKIMADLFVNTSRAVHELEGIWKLTKQDEDAPKKVAKRRVLSSTTRPV